MSKKKIIGGIGGAAAFIIISLLPVSDLLTREALVTLAALVGAVVWLLTDFMPDYLAMFSMCVMWVLFKAVPIGTAFASFAGSSWWLLFGALVIGAAASETGLLRRLALHMLKIFPATFRGQCVALVVSGTAISPLIPSQTAKSAIVAPLAKSISESMGFPYRSKGAIGIFLSFYTGYTSAGMGFLSASFVSYTLVGMLQGTPFATSWMQYFLWILPWTILSTAIMTLYVIKVYEPKEKTSFTKDYIIGEIEKIGKWSWQEKFVMGILIVCLLLWMTERIHGVAAWLVACIAAAIIMATNVIDRKGLRTKIAWDAMIFLGCFLGIGDAFKANGINDWVKFLLADKMSLVMGNIVIFIIVISLLTYITRFVLVSWTSAVVILGALLIPLCEVAGIHPFLALITIYVSTNTWNVIYQSTPVVTSMVATENKMVLHKDLIPASCVYMVVNILALLACIPLWKLLGLC